MDEEDYYEILQVSKGATIDEIKKKRKELSMKYHPDKLSAEERDDGNNMIKKINEAYEVLSDPEKRKMYDMVGKNGLNGNQSGFPSGFPGFPGFAGFAGFAEGFSGFPGFHQGFPGFTNIFNEGPKTKVRPIQEYIDVTLEQLYSGAEMVKEISRESGCNKCDSTGFEDKQKHICPSCKGRGVYSEVKHHGNMITQRQKTCPSCNGAGSDMTTKSIKKCQHCTGKGIIDEVYKSKLYIAKGMKDGDGIEVKNEGNVIRESDCKRRGPIIFILREQPHEIFKRGILNKNINNKDQSDLVLELEIPLHKALCGFVTNFKHLDGEEIYLQSQDIVNNGDIKVLPGKGMPYKNNNLNFGDLFIKFKVKTPDKLSESSKKQIYEALTDKKYNSSKLLKLPKDVTPATLVPMNNYSRNEQDVHDAHSQDSDDEGAENVQCAQQ